MRDGILPESRVNDLKSRTLWYVRLRWIILLLVIIPSLIASYFDVGWGERFFRDVMFCMFALASNGVFHILALTLKKYRHVRMLAYILTLADIVLITLFIYSKGGIESRSVVLYILPVIASAAILGRKGAYLTSGLAILTYTFVIIGGYTGILGRPLSEYTPELDHDPAYVANTIIFFDLVLAMAATGIDYMTRLLIRKEFEARVALDELRRTQLIAKVGAWEYSVAEAAITYSDELYEIEKAVLPSKVISAVDFEQLVHPDDRRMVRRKLQAALRRPGTFTIEHRMMSPDGIIQYIRSDGRSIASRDGTVEKLIGSARDITEERALQTARNDFVALASHQLRTPATIVKQYIAMLKDGYVGAVTSEQAKYLQTAYDNNERQIKIINDLLSVARIDSNSYRINRQRVDLVELLQTITRDQASKFAEKEQTLKLETNHGDMTAYVDSDSLRMAIDNLLDNAHKYTPNGRRVKVGLVKRAKSAVISVTDRGVGIAKTDMPKMFKMFSRVENPLTLQEEGTGLGLYWAQRIVKLHKGKITVQSEQGKGTTFTIILPLGTIKQS